MNIKVYEVDDRFMAKPVSEHTLKVDELISFSCSCCTLKRTGENELRLELTPICAPADMKLSRWAKWLFGCCEDRRKDHTE